MVHISSEVANLLDDLGLAMGVRQVEIIDFKQAEHCYIHHTLTPVAVVGYTLVSPTFARGRFPKWSFIDLIQKRPSKWVHHPIAGCFRLPASLLRFCRQP